MNHFSRYILYKSKYFTCELLAYVVISKLSNYRKEFQKVYERLNIKGLEERGESFYQDRMDAVVKLLNEKGG